MKVLVLCGLVALALAASPRWEQRRQPGQIREQQFRAGREYRYAFDGQVSTGLPQTSEQHASTRVQADVSIRFRDQHTALLQLQHIRFGAANRDIEEPRQIQPFGLFDEQKLTEEQQQQLELPLRFRYQDGIVSDIEFDREDVAWSENIKRSVLNLLQVNLQKTGRTDQQESRLLKEEQESRQTKKFDFFTAPERTLEGHCDVSYTMTEQRESESREPILFVQKSINFESCQERTDIRYNFRFSEQCNSCDKKFAQKERNLESTSVFNYNITGTPEQFLIRNVEVRSQYVFAPLNEQENTISAYVTAKLQLIETTEEKSVEEPKSPKQQQPLLYSAEWDKQKEKFHMTGNQEFTKNTPYTDSKQKVEIVQKLVNQIIKEMSDDQKGIELEANHQMARLVKVLRMANEEEVNKIHREIFESTKQDQLQTEQVQDILSNALAIAGTKHTIKHLVEKIQERQISPLKASYVLKALVNTRTVSEKQLELVHDLCKHQVSKRNPVLRQSCWLTYGAMVNAMCAENQDQLALEQDEQMCTREQKQKYTKIIMEQYQQASTRYEKVLALKTFANAGLDMSVFELEKIIRDRSEEKTIRMQAIDALRQLRSIMPRKIQNILMPIYKNKNEPADIRITAFSQIMHTLPERHILDQIVAQLERERSQHVQAFVYTTFMSYANSTNPCEKQLSKDVQVSLRLARVQPQNIPLSVYKQLPIYSEQYKSGWTLNWGSLFANDSYLPKELSASLDTVFMGQWNKYAAQIGITQQNLDSVLARIYRKVQKEGLDEVVVRGKRASNSFRPTELLRNLFEKLNIKSRQNLDSEEPHALLYIRYKDLDYAILPLDEQTIPEVVKQAFRGGKLQLSEIERILSQGYRFSTNVASFFYETSRKIPTALGMPLVINGKIPTIATVHGQISAELQPQNSEKLTGMKIRIQAQPQIASTHVTKMEIWNPIANTGLKMLHSVQANLPIDATINVNVEKELKIKVAVKAPEMKKRIAVVQTRPVTFVRSWPKNARSYVEPKEKTIYSEQFGKQVQPIKREYGEETIGMKVSVSGHFHRQPFTSVEGQPMPILAGENVLSIHVQPGKDTPREYVFELEAEPFIETSEVPQPEMKQFYSKKTQNRVSSSEEQLFDTESLETENQDEQERRQHYTRYVENYKAQRGYKHRLSLKAKTAGSQTERRAEAVIEAVCDEKVRFCQLKVDAQRTPIQEENRPWTFNLKAQTLYPEQPKSLEQLKQQKHREFTGVVNMKWGAEKKSSVEIQLQGEQNREQKEWLRRVERKQQQGLFEEELLLAAAHLNQYKAHIEFQLQPQTKNIINKVYQYLKSSQYWNTQYELVDNQEGQVQAQLTIDPESRRYVNISIVTPDEKVFIREALLPIRLGQNIRSQWQSTPVRSVHQLVQNIAKEQRSECSIKGSKINTFDDVIYKAPFTTCYSVLAKDCASSQPRFAVLAKKMNKNSEEKKVKIIDEQNKIEIEYKNQDFQVKVNDQMVQEERQQENYGIRQSGELIVVELEDVVVRFDGYNVKIHLSQMYQSQQCGLCGHYDGERDDEFRRADNEETDDLEDFHRSFLSQDEECEKDEEQLKNKKNYQLYESSESSSQEDQDQEDQDEQETRQRPQQRPQQRDSQEKETKKPVKRTKVIEYNHRVCFSKEPVPECPRKSYPDDESTTELKVKFACIERSHPEAQKLTRLARKQVVDMQAHPDSFVESLNVPQACVAY